MKYTISALAFLSITASGFAQEEVVPELPTTVVTGELWESEIQNTTASVTLLDDTVLDKSGVHHFEDVISLIPNLSWTGGSSRPRYIQIRGIGENSQFEGETPDSSVRFLIDDLDFTGLATVASLFDVAQVEVLRGPQAGAFGANAAGGVIKIVTADPTPYWTGHAEATLGNDNLQSGGFAIGGPLVEDDPEQLSFRLALHRLVRDGFRDNRFLNRDDTNERDEFMSRLKLRWRPIADWQWDASLFFANADNGYDEWSLDNTRFNTFSDEPGRDEQQSLAGSLKGSWTGLRNINITANTGFTLTNGRNSYDSDWTNPADPRTYNGFMNVDRDREVFSQEIQIDSTEQQDAFGWIDRWTIGAYLSFLEEDSDTSYRDQYGSVDAKTRYSTDSYALFGQLAHDFTDKTRFILGLRSEFHEVSNETLSLNDAYGAGLTEQNSQTDDYLFGTKLTLEHDLDESHLVFANTGVGYKTGGANGGVFRNPGDPLTYKTETLYNTELGFRSDWFEQQVSTEVTAFYLYREDPQLRDSGGSGGFFRYFTSNGDHAEHIGIEAAATWFITDSLTASAGLGYLEARNANNQELANAPSYTFNAQLDYEADNGFFASLSSSGSDEYFQSNNPNNRDQRIRSEFIVFNASIGYTSENWTLTLWSKNFFDEAYEKRVFFFGNEEPTYTDKRYENPANPRTFGITATYHW